MASESPVREKGPAEGPAENQVDASPATAAAAPAPEPATTAPTSMPATAPAPAHQPAQAVQRAPAPTFTPAAYGAPPARRILNIWWPMGFLIATVVFAAIGGGLFGAGINPVYDGSSADGYYDYEQSFNENMAIAGLALLCFSGLLSLTFWVLFIVWLVQRSRSGGDQPTIVYVNNAPAVPAPSMAYSGWGGNMPQQPQPAFVGYGGQYYPPAAPTPSYAQPQPQPQPQLQPQPQPQAQARGSGISEHYGPGSSSGVGMSEKRAEGRCACGSAINSPFCPQCGRRVQ